MIAETCLALAIYWEARNQPVLGQAAVAEVVLNRTESDLFPNDVCSVVRQGPHYHRQPIRNKCQFAWYCDGKSDVPKDKNSWNKALVLARLVMKLHPYTISLLPTTTFYFHSTKKRLHPFFRKKQLIAKIGDHEFFVEPAG